MKCGIGAFAFLLYVCLMGENANSQNSAGGNSVIPKPMKIQSFPGTFALDDSTIILCNLADQSTLRTAEYLGRRLRTATGFRFAIADVKHGPKSNYISLASINRANLGKEGYELSVNDRSVTLRSFRASGMFYAVQTFLQLLPPEIFDSARRSDIAWTMQRVAITDKPRFAWRGMHLDVCRHFFPVEFIKKYIDYLSMYKMNSFHWHLTEDQGWRIEIKRYPKLTRVGAWRNGSMVGAFIDQKFDSIRYGGYYTQEQIKEIVAYAQERHVTIVPEIEMPGHSLAALASYPELSCTGGPFEVGKAWGVYEDVYCPKESTFTFLENVLKEVCSLFPGKYIHIGGDECPKGRWKECPHCQALIKRKKLKNENRLQSYFIRRIEKFLNARGKQIIGWDEILEGGLAPKAAVMSWRGTEGGIAAAKQRHFVVMSPGSHCYFDHYQGNPKYEPLAIGGYTTVEKVYSYEPVPGSLKPNRRKYIMGAQGNVWTEYIQTPQQVEYMAMPRMSALAEVLWSPQTARDYGDFQNRLIKHFNVLDELGVSYSKSLFQLNLAVKPSGNGGIIAELSSAFEPQGIHYTLDDTDPSSTSPAYSSAVAITKNVSLKAAVFQSEKKLGPTIQQDFVVSKSTGKPVTLRTPPHENYFNEGAFTLVNGIRGDIHRHGRDWLGFWGPDMDAVIDLQQTQEVSKVTLDVYNDEGSWIYAPKSLEVLISTDNIRYMSVKKLSAADISRAGNIQEMKFDRHSARYVKVIAENAGKIPAGKPGEGKDSWLFVDEIEVE